MPNCTRCDRASPDNRRPSADASVRQKQCETDLRIIPALFLRKTTVNYRAGSASDHTDRADQHTSRLQVHSALTSPHSPPTVLYECLISCLLDQSHPCTITKRWPVCLKLLWNEQRVRPHPGVQPHEARYPVNRPANSPDGAGAYPDRRPSMPVPRPPCGRCASRLRPWDTAENKPCGWLPTRSSVAGD